MGGWKEAMLEAMLSAVSINPDQPLYPLHFACANADLGLVKKLLESRSQQVNQQFADLPNGSRPLHWAVCSGSSAIVQYLLAKHADVNQPNKNGSTPLHLACQGGSVEIVTRLVQAGGKTSVRDKHNKLPLDYWMKHGEPSARSAEAAWKSLQTLLADDSSHQQYKAEKLKETISDAYDQLQEEAARSVELRDSPDFLSPSSSPPPPARDKTKIHFQVGHRVFSSSRHVLMRHRSSKLTSLVEQAETEACESPRLTPTAGLHGAFPERDGELFGKILTFLESGRAPHMRSERECRQVMREASFFDLPALVKLCEKILEQWHFRKVTPGCSLALAIDEAKDGETLLLAAGHYKENLVLRKSVTLRGETQLRDHADSMLGSRSLHGAYHGDPLHHKFVVLPADVQGEGNDGNGLQRRMRGRAEEICSRAEFIGAREDDGREFCCLGHVVISAREPDRPVMVIEEGSVLVSDLILLRADEDSSSLSPPSSTILVQSKGLLLMEKCLVESQGDVALEVRGGGRANVKESHLSSGVSCLGSLTLDDCRVAGGCGVTVAGEGDASVRKTRVTGAKEFGIYVKDEGSGTFSANEVSGCGRSGVAIASRSKECSLRINKSFENREAGVLVFNGASPTISGGQLYRNQHAGLVSIASSPILSACEVWENLGCGVLFDRGSSGMMRQCDVSRNHKSGILVRNLSSTSIEDCNISHGLHCGVVVTDRSSPLLSDCHILANRRVGFAVGKRSRPVASRCVMEENSIGLCVFDQSGGKFADCRVTRNRGVQVQVTRCRLDGPLFTSCLVTGGPSCGFLIRGAESKLEDCEVSSQASFGLLAEGDATRVKCDKCRISDNGGGGVCALDEAKLELTRSSVADNKEVGACCKAAACLEVTSCSLERNVGPGVWFAGGGTGMVEKSEVRGSHGFNVVCDSSSATVRECQVVAGKEGGVLCSGGGGGVFSRNSISGNRPAGFIVSKGCNPSVFHNSIVRNEPYGIFVLEGGLGHVYANVLEENEMAPVLLHGTARSVVADNNIAGGANGVLVCWSDGENKIRNVSSLEMQRVGFGQPSMDMPTVRERLLDLKDVSIKEMLASLRALQSDQQSRRSSQAQATEGAQESLPDRRSQPQVSEALEDCIDDAAPANEVWMPHAAAASGGPSDRAGPPYDTSPDSDD
ncbi:hypothetical protein GUITHDRAFT_166549, partial [Guillardia theta CCMP2712]